jgi:hypothetical protein
VPAWTLLASVTVTAAAIGLAYARRETRGSPRDVIRTVVFVIALALADTGLLLFASSLLPLRTVSITASPLTLLSLVVLDFIGLLLWLVMGVALLVGYSQPRVEGLIEKHAPVKGKWLALLLLASYLIATLLYVFLWTSFLLKFV